MLGVIMTGIGHDGAQGASELYTKGKGYILIQDQESSTVWGMPKNTLRKDCVSEIHSLDRLGKRINRITSYNVCYTKLLRICRGLRKYL